MAAACSSRSPSALWKDPSAPFMSPGRTTEILQVTPRAGGYDIKLLGGTKDLSAGQVLTVRGL